MWLFSRTFIIDAFWWRLTNCVSGARLCRHRAPNSSRSKSCRQFTSSFLRLNLCASGQCGDQSHHSDLAWLRVRPTIVGEVRGPPACPRRGRRETVCARGAWVALLGGPSTSLQGLPGCVNNFVCLCFFRLRIFDRAKKDRLRNSNRPLVNAVHSGPRVSRALKRRWRCRLGDSRASAERQLPIGRTGHSVEQRSARQPARP